MHHGREAFQALEREWRERERERERRGKGKRIEKEREREREKRESFFFQFLGGFLREKNSDSKRIPISSINTLYFGGKTIEEKRIKEKRKESGDLITNGRGPRTAPGLAVAAVGFPFPFLSFP